MRTSREIYEELAAIRSPFLARAMACAMYTIPSLLSGTGNGASDTSGEMIGVGFNTRGPQLVNHAANVYMQTLFPASRSFFRIALDPDLLDKVVISDDNPNGIEKSLLEYKLSRHENKAKLRYEKQGHRKAGLEALKHLIVTGNCLYVCPDPKVKKGRAQVYAMDEYTVRTDLDGNMIECIMLDKKAIINLPVELRASVMKQLNYASVQDTWGKTVELYTHLRLNDSDNSTWLVRQEVEGICVPGSERSIKAEDMRWFHLTWDTVRREMWGRGLVELYSPVFHAVEVLNEALVTGAAITLDFKFLVDPSSPIDILRLNDSATGTYHYGRRDDVNLVSKALSGDIAAIDALVQRLEGILNQAFLWNVPRSAERVTAEEIRTQVRELQQSHGGNFGNFAVVWQLPLAENLLRGVDIRIGKIKEIEPLIITGLDALGRVSVNEQITMVFQDLSVVAQYPQELLQQLGVKWNALFKTLCAGRDVDTDTFCMTDQEIKDAMEAEQQRQLELQSAGSAQNEPQKAGPPPLDASAKE